MNALLPTYIPFPFELSHGSGETIYSTDGTQYTDFYGGHCVVSTGHSHPHVVAAIAKQAGSLIFYSAAGFLKIRERAANDLVQFANWPEAQVFFCNSGAEANENALKLAHKISGKGILASCDGGWHGRSLACLAVTDDIKITEPYRSWLPSNRRLKFNDLADLAAADLSDVAAVIIEPIQSLNGIRVADFAYLKALRAKTTESGTLLIFDEIQTGVGRLGTPFAANFFDVQPDIITSAKGLASGVPIGALIISADCASAIKPGDLGSTFGGGPIACAALCATLEVITQEKLMQNAALIEQTLRTGLQGSGVAVLGHGALLGLQHERAADLRAFLLQNHILSGASAKPDVLRLMPPLMCSQAAIAKLLNCIWTFIRLEPPC